MKRFKSYGNAGGKGYMRYGVEVKLKRVYRIGIFNKISAPVFFGEGKYFYHGYVSSGEKIIRLLCFAIAYME